MPSANARIVLTGAGGQFGQTLVARWPDSLLSQYELIPLMRGDLDIADAAAVHSTLDALQPALIINAAAYTAVDKAESEAEAAFAINERGVANLAASSTCPLIHLSTDFVFDGAASTPYAESAATAPLSVYGKSKLAGEKALLAQKPWLYGWLVPVGAFRVDCCALASAASRGNYTHPPCWPVQISCCLPPPAPQG